MSLTSLAELINKKYGKDIIFSAANNLGIQEIPRFSSGSLSLDVDLGGGWPRNKIIEIYGPESSGKSFMLYNAIATVTNQSKNNKVVLIDEEGSFDIPWANKIGVKTENLQIVRSEYAEQALDIMEITVQSGEYALVALDSIAALIPKDELDKSTEEWQMGLTARLMAKACRKCYRALNQSKRTGGETTVFLINQLRKKIGVVFGSPEVTTGGESVKYASSIRLDIRKHEMIKSGEEVIGQTSKYTAVKNKTAPPLRKGSFSYYISGESAGKLDNIRALAEFGEEMGYIEKSGSWFSGEWLSKKVQGFNAVIADLEEKSAAELNEYLKTISVEYLEGHPLEFSFNE